MATTIRIDRTVEGLLAHTFKDGACRRWIGAHITAGYGYVHGPDGSKVYVHRLMHELAIGPIPDGLTVDHVYARGCRFTDCILPAHLEAVPVGENSRRQGEALRERGTCRRGGHAMTPANTYITPSGKRRCTTCVNARKRRDYHASKKEIVHA